jgi:hypothetical protein
VYSGGKVDIENEADFKPILDDILAFKKPKMLTVQLWLDNMAAFRVTGINRVRLSVLVHHPSSDVLDRS